MCIITFTLVGAARDNSEPDGSLPLGILNQFSSNPIYETNDEATYETVAHSMGLRSLPPPLPARNHQASVSPTLHPTKHSEERNGSIEEGHQAAVHYSSDAEYVTMSSPSRLLEQPPISPRYTEGPHFKLTTSLEPLPEHPTRQRSNSLPDTKLQTDT